MDRENYKCANDLDGADLKEHQMRSLKKQKWNVCLYSLADQLIHSLYVNTIGCLELYRETGLFGKGEIAIVIGLGESMDTESTADCTVLHS